MAAVGAVVALGLLGVLGPTTRTVASSAGSMRVEVAYAAVTRAGLATPWAVEVRRPGGFDGPIRIATTGTYFDGLDFNELYPEPVEMTSKGELVVFEFAPPEGELFRVRLDARATPAWTLWRSAVTTVSVPGLPEARVSYRTIFLP